MCKKAVRAGRAGQLQDTLTRPYVIGRVCVAVWV